jgi:hypothetical protein
MPALSQVCAATKVVSNTLCKGSGYEGDARHKVLWHRERFTQFLQHQDHLVRPVTVEFWPSLSCPARCPLCPYRRNNARRRADRSAEPIMTTLEIARRVAEQVVGFGAKSVLLTGGGEPFYNPEIDRIAQIMSGQGLKLGVYTNGTVPEREQQIRNIIALGPQFVRMSVNAGSEKEHQQEYRIAPYRGTTAWEQLKRNALTFLDAIADRGVDTTFGFSFVLLGHERPASYVGMARFVAEIHRRAGGNPLFAHFRPKMLYHHRDGSVVAHIPPRLVKGIAAIPGMVERYVMPELAQSPGVTIQTNRFASRLVSGAEPTSCFCTGWCTSFNHLGEGYILSELCGTPWAGAKWGDLRTQTMHEAWDSPLRHQIHQDYATGRKKAPIYNKLTGIQRFLSEIREAAPRPFTDAEVEQFWAQFEVAKFSRPRSWDFI